jgi:hypothetical protein
MDRWHYGITFQHYYRGAAPWTTIPPIGFYDFHRYDLLKKEMMRSPQTEVVQPVINVMTQTLRAGRKIWIVGGSDLFDFKQSFALLPAPQTEWKWAEPAYMYSWLSGVGVYLQQHSTNHAIVYPPDVPPNHMHERHSLLRVEGWKN